MPSLKIVSDYEVMRSKLLMLRSIMEQGVIAGNVPALHFELFKLQEVPLGVNGKSLLIDIGDGLVELDFRFTTNGVFKRQIFKITFEAYRANPAKFLKKRNAKIDRLLVDLQTLLTAQKLDAKDAALKEKFFKDLEAVIPAPKLSTELRASLLRLALSKPISTKGSKTGRKTTRR